MRKNPFDGIRSTIMQKVIETLGQDFDILRTGSNEICIPIVSEAREEGYLVIVFRIPTGTRDGESYDGYAEAEDYARREKQRAEKTAAKAAKRKEK